jgi:hypothetical protein
MAEEKLAHPPDRGGLFLFAPKIAHAMSEDADLDEVTVYYYDAPSQDFSDIEKLTVTAEDYIAESANGLTAIFPREAVHTLLAGTEVDVERVA